MKFRCSFCDIVASSMDDPKFFWCRKNGHTILQTLDANDVEAAVNIYQKEQKTNRIEESINNLTNLIQIENPQLAGKLVRAKAVVASNSISYNVPAQITARCFTSEVHDCKGERVVDLRDSDMVQFIDVKDFIRAKTLRNVAKRYLTETDCQYSISENKSTTLKKLRIRPIVSSLEKMTASSLTVKAMSGKPMMCISSRMKSQA